MAPAANIAFGEWLPDQPDRAEGATEAKGVISRAGAYTPFRSTVDINPTGATLAGTCRGAFSCYDATGLAHVFLATSTRIYKLVDRALVDVSPELGYTAVPSDDTWQFAQFGDLVIAAQANAAPQVFDLGDIADFAALSGTPPTFDTIATIGDFVVGARNTRVDWSAFNNATTWGFDPALQSGGQDFDPAGGRIRALFGGEYGALFQERQIRRMSYVGPPLVWRFDLVEEQRGLIGRNAAVKWGRAIYYASEDGFYVFDGTASTPIGQGRVDRYFMSRLNYPQRNRIMAAVDPINKCVLWGFPSGAGTEISEVMIYSLTDGRWTHDDLAAQHLFNLPRFPFSLDQLTDVLDDLDFGLDDEDLADGRTRLACVTSANRLAVFDGQTRPATLETTEFEPAPGRRALVTELWPVCDAPASNITAALRSRPALPGEAIVLSSATAVNRAGFCPQRVDARFLRARVSIGATDDWQHAEGVHYVASLTGGR